MPQLIRTPEEIFRTEGKDIYFLKFKDEKPESKARTMMLAWLKENVPDSKLEPLVPSESAGWILGYFGALRVDFTESDLPVFCNRWENPDGSSVDKRFQCYLMPYSRWFEKFSKYPATHERPASIGVTVWWDTPYGFYYHQIPPDTPAEGNAPLLFHPCNKYDLWLSATKLNPLLNELDRGRLTDGQIAIDENGDWVVFYSDSPFHSTWTEQRQQEFIDWFRLPVDVACERTD